MALSRVIIRLQLLALALALATAGPAAAQLVRRDVAYGGDPAQRMDIYAPAHAAAAPVLVVVHGGGWRGGSKSAAGVIANKIAHYVPRGIVVISVEYRLLPAADPLAQAEDVARAVAAAQRLAPTFGGDPHRFVLMGHSSGAHLVMLLNADPAIARRLGARPWRGLVALDSGAYDVTAIMTRPHMKFYDQAFGADPAYWRSASPQARLVPGGPPSLLVCSSLRRLACPSAEAYATAARDVGDRAEVLPVAMTHSAIDDDLGQPGAYTDSVDRFIAAITR